MKKFQFFLNGLDKADALADYLTRMSTLEFMASAFESPTSDTHHLVESTHVMATASLIRTQQVAKAYCAGFEGANPQ